MSNSVATVKRKGIYLIRISRWSRDEIMKYEIDSRPYLVGFEQLRLDRIESVIEAFHVEH